MLYLSQKTSRFARGAILATLLTACTSSPYDDADRVNAGFSTIAIASSDAMISADTPDSKDDRGRTGAFAGAAGGALSGAAIGAATCAPAGPWAALCATFSGIAGAFYGMLAGGVAGGIAASSTGIANADAAYLEAEARHLRRNSYEINATLVENLQHELPANMLRSADEADVQVLPVVEQISFEKGDEDTVRIVVTAGLAFAGTRGDSPRNRGYLGFSVRSGHRPVAEWLDADGEAIAAEIDRCLDKIASEMAGLILEKRVL